MAGLPPNTLFSVFAFLGFILTGIPLPWHLLSWNVGSSVYMLWTCFGCLILFINSIIWNDNVINSAPIWCDISVRYLIGASVGIPASSFCIIRRLYYITKLEVVSVGRAERRRQIMFDISVGIGFPCVVMALEYVVQGRRFAIYEQVGCYPYTMNTPLAYPLTLMWPLLFGSISFVYAALTFRRVFRQKERLRRILREGFESVSLSYYWRLMALCCTEIVFTVPLSLYAIIGAAVIDGPSPYVSWAFVHADFSQIPQIPTVVWKSDRSCANGIESVRWEFVLCAFVSFAFFGWAREIRSLYSRMFWSVCCHLRCLRQSQTSLPITVSRTKRTFARAGELILPVHDADQGPMGSNRLSMSFRAREGRISSGTSFLSSELSLDVSAHHVDVPSANMPATPEPALARDQPSFVITHLA